MSHDPAASPARHASWLELFFDLVAVVAVAQLAHFLRDEPDWRHIGLYLVVYYAIWSVWTSYTIYGNVRGDRARVRFMVYGMAALGVMAAAVPGITGDRADVFAAVYIAFRVTTSRSWSATGTVVTVWPAAQLGAGLTPWIVSLWMDDEWKYLLWALGAAVDILISMGQGRNPQELMAQLRSQQERRRRQRDRAGRPRRGPGGPKDLTEARVDAVHLGERVGLLMIIVLGESIKQVVDVAAEEPWHYPLWIAGGAGFAIAVCLWLLTFTYGGLAVPHVARRHLPTWLALPGHFVMTAAVTATAAGTGALMMEPEHHAATGYRWLLCGGLAVFFAVTVVSGILLGSDRSWLWTAAIPAVLVPTLLGAVGGLLPGYLVVVAAALVTGWCAWWARHRDVGAEPLTE